MLTDMFNEFVGAKVVMLKEIYDYWQLFTEVAVINVFTNFYMKKGDTKITDTNAILNQHIIKVSLVEKECLIFTLENCVDFCVSINPDDYVGPEAYCISFYGSSIDIVD